MCVQVNNLPVQHADASVWHKLDHYRVQKKRCCKPDAKGEMVPYYNPDFMFVALAAGSASYNNTVLTTVYAEIPEHDNIFIIR